MNKKNKVLKKSITHLQLDQDGFVVGVKGKLRARDLQHSKNVAFDLGYEKFDKYDFCKLLEIRRID